MPATQRDQLLDLVAAHPGATYDELRQLCVNDSELVDPWQVGSLLQTAHDQDKVIKLSDGYHVVRQ